ncbi:CAMK/CAMKL/PASK protein kinase [Allomyces macrogynus ATCC 38327]|uniref:CAMK/CAMKL/PASK protein kinase n=1 Tax=Allomyces macrogynus (strain ATCC 38327) TaxID=578462 RepID=A0A0L0SSD9_ALLM3|nr:CAMK/CAMKL/PASK protein kinase [Allomyces macrogynus ATCC 38327]|eukprot:KNE65427.1 CAMK/CAMKL/PASK protein kinase [Allomyces macrogynus ATCC 38327]
MLSSDKSRLAPSPNGIGTAAPQPDPTSTTDLANPTSWADPSSSIIKPAITRAESPPDLVMGGAVAAESPPSARRASSLVSRLSRAGPRAFRNLFQVATKRSASATRAPNDDGGSPPRTGEGADLMGNVPLHHAPASGSGSNRPLSYHADAGHQVLAHRSIAGRDLPRPPMGGGAATPAPASVRPPPHLHPSLQPGPQATHSMPGTPVRDVPHVVQQQQQHVVRPLVLAAAPAVAAQAAPARPMSYVEPIRPVARVASEAPKVLPPAAIAPVPAQPGQAKSLAQSVLERHPLCREFVERYEIGDELGSGGFGFVVTATRRSDNREVAVKFIFKEKVPVHSLTKDPELGVVPMEIFVLKKVRHPSIVEFYDFFQDNVFYYLVMELFGSQWKKSGAIDAVKSQDPPSLQRSYSEPTPKAPVLGRRQSMDLFECIEASQKLSESTARTIFRQVVGAVCHLASHNLLHRDLKDENLVITSSFNVKLIDFGSAAFLPANGRLFDRFAGTLQYCPPEILQGQKYRGPEQEVWALGILLYTILFSGAPFANTTQVIQTEMPVPRYSRGPKAGTPKASREAVHLLQWMLQKHPGARASLAQVAAHPWLRDLQSSSSSTSTTTSTVPAQAELPPTTHHHLRPPADVRRTNSAADIKPRPSSMYAGHPPTPAAQGTSVHAPHHPYHIPHYHHAPNQHHHHHLHANHVAPDGHAHPAARPHPLQQAWRVDDPMGRVAGRVSGGGRAAAVRRGAGVG